MSERQVTAVRQFVREGGALIATHETSLRDAKGQARSDFALADVLGVRFQRVLPAAARSLRFRGSSPWAEKMAAFSPLAAGHEPHVAVSLTTGQVAAHAGGTDAAEPELPAVVVNSFGQGRAVYLPGRLDAQQCAELSPGVEQLFAEAVRWASNDRLPVEVIAPAMVGVSLSQQPDRWLIQLVNHNRDSRFQSDSYSIIEHVTVRLHLPAGRKVAAIRRLWDRSDVGYRHDRESLIVELPKLNEYEALAVTFHSMSENVR
jgi:hypothetical protein